MRQDVRVIAQILNHEFSGEVSLFIHTNDNPYLNYQKLRLYGHAGN